MAWDLLPTNYTDAVWSGLKRYNTINNEDGTVSFQDVTTYSNKETSFFGAKQANRMNEALNAIMSMVEGGTDLYTAFQNYFNTQKGLFTDAAYRTQTELTEHLASAKAEADELVDDLKTDYQTDIDTFKVNQESKFNLWFDFIKGLFGEDVAGNLQNQLDLLEKKTDGFNSRETVFSEDGSTINETYGNKRIETIFVSDETIIQKIYEDNALTATKTITFAGDGLSIREDVV